MRFLTFLLVLLFIIACNKEKNYLAGHNVAINKIKIMKFPSSNNGVPWDDDSPPDITFGIANQDNYIIYMFDSVIMNVSDDKLPLEIKFPNELLPTIYQDYSIILFEVDSLNKEKIGEKVIFKPYQLVKKYYDDIESKNLQGEILLENEYILLKVYFLWDNSKYY